MPSRAIHIAERLAHRFIPDLGDYPLYFVAPRDGSMVTRAMMTGDGCYFPQLDKALRPQLEIEGRWRGEGIAVVVDDAPPAGCDEYVAERAIIGLALHELAHWVCRAEPDEPDEPVADHYARFLGSRELTKAAYADRGPTHISGALWAHHSGFIRCCVHLWWRCNYGVDGYILSPKWFGFGNTYPGLEMLSPPGRYIESLWAELHEHRHRPLRAILAIEPPAEFSQIWTQDLARVFDAALAARAQAA